MTLALTLAMLLIPLQAPANPTVVTGAWEGSSLCTVPTSPCHDEHVVYYIKAADSHDSTKFTIDANKVINGAEESMGTLQCSFTTEKSELRCDTFGDWRFRITGNTISGTLNLKSGTLYRKISLTKK